MVTRNGAECPFMGALGSPSEHGLTGTEQSLKDQPSKASLTTVKTEWSWFSWVSFLGSLSYMCLTVFKLNFFHTAHFNIRLENIQ